MKIKKWWVFLFVLLFFGLSSLNEIVATIGLFSLIGIFVYFIPTMVAHKRGHTQKTAIVLLNLFLGWTFIGWVGALVWASIKEK